MGRKDYIKQIVKNAFKREVENTESFYKCQFCGQKYAWNATRMAKHLIHKCLHCPENMKSSLKRRSKSSTSSGSSTTYLRGLANNDPVLNTSRPSETAQMEITDPSDECDDENDTLSTMSSRSVSVSITEPSGSSKDFGHFGTSSPQASSSFISGNQAQKSMASFVDCINRDEEKEIWELLSRACYATAAPLNFTESIYWQQAFKKLRPSLKLPSRYQLSNSLLNSEYQRVKSLVEEKIKTAKTVGIQIDGWSNVRQEPIVNVIVTVPEPLLYKTIDTGINRHNAIYLCQIISETITEIGIDKILAVITDNASNMTLCWELLQQKYPDSMITCYGCSAHILNLLASDILKLNKFKRLSSVCAKIVKIIKKSHILNATFQNPQRSSTITTNRPRIKTLKLPAETRWGSMSMCLESLRNNKQSLQELGICESVADILAKHANFKSTILSDSFWKNVESFNDVLLPLFEHIKQIQTSKPFISHVVEIFHNLNITFSESCSGYLKTSIIKLLEKRKQMALQPIHLAANLLDPYYMGNNLKNEEYIKALSYINTLSSYLLEENGVSTVMREMGNYKGKEDLFNNQFVWNSLKDGKLDAVVWWKSICATTALGKVATQILNCPATTAATERSFSQYANIHSKVRNRLTNERSSKLIYVKNNLSLSEVKNNVKERDTDYFDSESEATLSVDIPTSNNCLSTLDLVDLSLPGLEDGDDNDDIDDSDHDDDIDGSNDYEQGLALDILNSDDEADIEEEEGEGTSQEVFKGFKGF